MKPTLLIVVKSCLIVAVSSLEVRAEGNPAADLQSATLTAEQQERLRFVLSGFKTEKERLRTGIFHAKGKKSSAARQNTSMGTYDGNVELFGAFDFDKGLFRFDRKEPISEYLPKARSATSDEQRPADEAALELRVAPLAMRYVRTAKESIHSTSGWLLSTSGTISIRKPEAEPVPQLRPMDVRNLGMCTASEMNSGLTFEKAFAYLSRRDAVTGVVAETDDVYRVDQINASGNIKSSIWFDATQGFSPIRSEWFNKWKDQWWTEPFTATRMTWERINGAWVPKSFSDAEDRGGTERYDLTFEWKAVNEDVPQELFTLDAIEQNDDKIRFVVVDETLGRNIIVKVPDTANLSLPGVGTDTIPESRQRSRLLWILAANLIVALAVIGFWFRRRWSKA